MSIRKLSMLESMRLMNLIETEFLAKGMTDVEFARYAAEKLGFPVQSTSVLKRRNELGIPSTRIVPGDTEKELRGLAKLVMDLSQRVAALEGRLL